MHITDFLNLLTLMASKMSHIGWGVHSLSVLVSHKDSKNKGAKEFCNQ